MLTHQESRNKSSFGGSRNSCPPSTSAGIIKVLVHGALSLQRALAFIGVVLHIYLPALSYIYFACCESILRAVLCVFCVVVHIRVARGIMGGVAATMRGLAHG